MILISNYPPIIHVFVCVILEIAKSAGMSLSFQLFHVLGRFDAALFHEIDTDGIKADDAISS
jgi:hypothetical protein